MSNGCRIQLEVFLVFAEALTSKPDGDELDTPAAGDTSFEWISVSRSKRMPLPLCLPAFPEAEWKWGQNHWVLREKLQKLSPTTFSARASRCYDLAYETSC